MEPVRASASSVGSGGGYSRRCIPGDPKSADRQRLMTDRAAYIAYLEAQIERTEKVCEESEAVQAGVHRIRDQVTALEDKVRNAGVTIQMVQEYGERTGESVRESHRELDDQLRTVEGRVQRLEHSVGESNFTSDSQTARLRNEFMLAMQELEQRLDERFHASNSEMRSFCSRAEEAIREAQSTCVRLADDTLGAAESSQQKLQEFKKTTEAKHEVLCMDLTGIRAELAGLQSVRGQRSARSCGDSSVSTALAPGVMSSWESVPAPKMPLPSGQASQESVASVADALEKRLSARLGAQILQLSEVLQRVVKAQAAIHKELASSNVLGDVLKEPLLGKEAAVAGTSPLPGSGSLRASTPNESHRRAAIDDLYRELRQLEQSDVVKAKAGRCSPHHRQGPRAPRGVVSSS